MPRRFGYEEKTVPARLLVDSFLQHFEFALLPWVSRPPLPELTFGGISKPILWFFRHLGKRVKYISNQGQIGLQLTLPTWAQVSDEYMGRLPPFEILESPSFHAQMLTTVIRRNLVGMIEANSPSLFETHPHLRSSFSEELHEFTEEEGDCVKAFFNSVDTGPPIDFNEFNGLQFSIGNYEVHETPEELLLLFDSLPKKKQEALLPLLRKDLAGMTLTYWLEQHCPPGVLLIDQFGLARPALPKLRFMMDFYDTLFWESVVSPTEPIRQFLPAVSLPRQEAGPVTTAEPLITGSCGGEPVKLSTRQVERSDPRVNPERFDFYTNELGCRAVVEPVERFMDGNYVAFLLRASSGLRVAILDCKEEKNAAYVFRIGRPHEAGCRDWIHEAVLSKGEVLARKESENSSTFMRRFCHTATWKQQVRTFLESH